MIMCGCGGPGVRRWREEKEEHGEDEDDAPKGKAGRVCLPEADGPERASHDGEPGLVRWVGVTLALELLPRRSGCRQDREHVEHVDQVRRLGGNDAEELTPIARVTEDIRDLRKPRSQFLAVELNRAAALVLERRCSDGGGQVRR